MEEKLKVSVAMTVYNAEKFIKKAIKSIVGQTYKNWEIIIVDDMSKDKSVNIIYKVIKLYNIQNKIKFFQHKKNYGYGKTLKDAIEKGNGDLIAIVDSDDALANNKALKIMAQEHIKHPEASLVYSNYYKCTANLKPCHLGPSKQIPEGRSYLNTKVRISHLKVFKRSAYNKTVGLNPKLKKSVDKDLILKLEEKGSLVFVNKPLYYYRTHNNNLTRLMHTMPKSYQNWVIKMRNQIYIDAKKRRGIK